MSQKVKAKEIKLKESRPEIELLICCARTSIDSTMTERIKTILQGKIDWKYLIEIASQHATKPVLYHHLSSICPEAVPQPIFDRLRNDYRANALRNMSLTKELLKLLNLFEKHQIPAITYKGAALTAALYGNLSLRQFGDLDILVQPQDFSRAKELLISQGYHPDSTFEWEESLINHKTRVNVDLHKRIAPKYFPLLLDFEDLWQRLETVSLIGTTVTTLCTEDLLIILAMQITKDSWEQEQKLSQICDIAELIRSHQQLDWGRIIKQAKSLGSERMLLISLLLAKDILDAKLPAEIEQRLQGDRLIKLLAAKLRRWLFDSSDSEIEKLQKLFFFPFGVRERLQDKINYGRRLTYLSYLAVKNRLQGIGASTIKQG
ncbi:nucleotidyltransferase family protein [Planktothrix sp. FACHB-1365]|uniref:nucleotidyltransferase domain-containing protein n=1 Tax=Planktothrix sp. FACHB-1365 TaxID=2692855 RepID=UPI001689D4CE|nr:nucleotidyltransferase family protein [Planktothrix sp. FACHB-1365]MBD2482581.1 nucleotidyltransferase family protein [Planktothrix sp. FACHB-1365]